MDSKIVAIKYTGLLMILLVLTFFLACVAAIPVIVYYKSKANYVATVEIKVEAEKVYLAAIQEAEARPHLEILEKNHSEFFLEVTDGKQTASVKAVAIAANKTKLIVTADVQGVEQEKEKELALRVADVICASLGVNYRLIEA